MPTPIKKIDLEAIGDYIDMLVFRAVRCVCGHVSDDHHPSYIDDGTTVKVDNACTVSGCACFKYREATPEQMDQQDLQELIKRCQ